MLEIIHMKFSAGVGPINVKQLVQSQDNTHTKCQQEKKFDPFSSQSH